MPTTKEEITSEEVAKIGADLERIGQEWLAFAAGLPEEARVWAAGRGSVHVGLTAANQMLGRMKAAMTEPGNGDPKQSPRKSTREGARKRAKKRGSKS